MEKFPKHSANQGTHKIRQQFTVNASNQSNRMKYNDILQWSKKQLSKMRGQIQSSQKISETELINQQKKVIISMLLEIGKILKQQCVEKGIAVQQMLQLTLQFMNQHQKHYDMLSYMQIKHFRDTTQQIQKQYKTTNEQLRQQIKVLKKDKQHRWRNIYMVLKDNRILRRRNCKLLKTHRQLIWKVKQLQEDLISLRSYNQKYRLLNEQGKCQQNNLKTYITNQLLLCHLDQKIKLYPGRAKRILKKQLMDSEINQLKNLPQKIKFIIQAMNQNGQVCQQFDSWNDNIQTTRLFYNISVQTYIEKQNVGINTTQPLIAKKSYQSVKTQIRVKDFIFLDNLSKVFDIKITPGVKKMQKKRNQDSMMFGLSQSRFKKRVSTSSNYQVVKTSNSLHKKTKFKIQKTINIVISGYKSKKNKNQTINPMETSKKQKDIVNQQEMKQNIFNIKFSTQRQRLNLHKLKVSTTKLRSRQFLLEKQMNKFSKKHENIIKMEEQDVCKFTQSYNQIVDNPQHLEHLSQTYQFYYKPAEAKCKKQQKEPNQEDILLDLEEYMFLQQKPKVIKQKKPLQINRFNSVSYRKTTVQNKQIFQNQLRHKSKKRNTQMCEENLKDKIFIRNNQAISEAHQTNSKKSSQCSSKSKVIQRFGQSKQKSREGFIIKNRSRYNAQNASRESISFLVSKRKNYIHHRRQNTQNLQILHKNRRKRYQLAPAQTPILQLLPKDQCQKQANEITNKMQARVKSNDEYSLSNIRHQTRKNTKNQDKFYHNLKTANCKKPENLQNRYFINGQKLLQKVICNIYEKRKQIINNPQTMRQYCQKFLSIIIYNKQVVPNSGKNKIIYNFLQSIKNSDVRKQFRQQVIYLIEKLIPIKGYQPFSQDLFVLFAKMLDKLSLFGLFSSIDSLYHVQKQYALKVLEYLCSIYFSKSQSEEFICKIRTQFNSVNMIQAFIKLTNQLQKIIFESQLWQFLESICSCMSQSLEQAYLCELVQIFNYSTIENEIHKPNLQFYISRKYMHRLCLYASRFQWKEMRDIKTWIKQKYLQYFGTFYFGDTEINKFHFSIQYKLDKYSNKFNNLLHKFRKLNYRFRNCSIPINQSFLKFCKLAINFQQFQNLNIFPNNLLIIQSGYKSILRRGIKSNQNLF